MTLLPRLLSPALVGLLLAGCAATPEVHDPQDPYEGFNRTVYEFNQKLDEKVLQPVARGYDRVVPDPLDRGITNFFSNLDDVLVVFNDLLQLKGRQTAEDASRLVFNTTFGLLGFIDVASGMELPKHEEDFGQTLGYWGVGPGPYIVLPLFGPSDVRDAVGWGVDLKADPVWKQGDRTSRYGAKGVDVIDTRADLLRATRLIDQAALDPYLFMRDAYLQRRQSLVYDGNPPAPEFDPFEEFEADGPAP